MVGMTVRDVPTELLIIIAIAAALALVKLVLVLLTRLGAKGRTRNLLAAVVLAALYASVTFIVAWRASHRLETLALRERARLATLRTQLAGLGSAPAPLEQRCAGAPMIPIHELVVAYEDPDLKLIEYRGHGRLYADFRRLTTDSPSVLATWALVAERPLKYENSLPMDIDYVLASKRYALVVDGDRAALIELDGDHLVCDGSLPLPFRKGAPSTDFEPLNPLCARIEGDPCRLGPST